MNMDIKEFYSLEDKAYWLSQIRKSDWRADDESISFDG